MDLKTKTPVPDSPQKGDCVEEAPCVFCGKTIQHVNDGGVGCVANALVDGKLLHFLYCNDPICPEREEAERLNQGIKTCSCDGYKAFDVIGETCGVCRKAPQPWNPCPWCNEEQDRRDNSGVIVTNLGEELDGIYCSSDCLFHQLLSERTDEEAFCKVQEILNLTKN